MGIPYELKKCNNLRMKITVKNTCLVFGIALLFTTVSCVKDKKIVDEKPPFDRKVMLENIGNEIIIPNYNTLLTQVQALNLAVDNFTAAPNDINLEECKTAFLNSWKAWQHCSTFEIGPAEQRILRANINSFPTDTNKINNNIRSGSYNLATASNLTAKGFPSIDFLLFHSTLSSDIVLQYTTDEHAEKRKQYLNTLVAEIVDQVTYVNNQWIASGGNYIGTFTTSLGNNAGSSIGMLVNQLNYDYEIIKTNKLGIPLGKKSLGTPYPEKVEAYYCGKSMDLIKENFNAIEALYLGKTSSGTNKTGLDDYLLHLDAKHNSSTLDAAIKEQFVVTRTAIAAVPDPLSSTILNNTTLVNSAYIEIQKAVVLLKADMPSALGVLITYQDNDGD